MSDDQIFQLSKKDLAFGTVYEPAWYRVRIENSYAEPSKNLEKPSTNYWLEGTILFNADTGDRKYEDMPLKWFFNSNAMGNTKGFLVALGQSEDDVNNTDKRWSFKSSWGKEIDIFVENGLWEGRTTNKVNHKYRAPREA